MKLQVCWYKETKDDTWKCGIACVPTFGILDISYILNENGEKIKSCWDYKFPPVFPGHTGVGYWMIDTDHFKVPTVGKFAKK